MNKGYLGLSLFSAVFGHTENCQILVRHKSINEMNQQRGLYNN